jgi:transglutaminase-like putative cysteine protease
MTPSTRLALVGGSATMLTSLCLTPLFENSSPWFGRAFFIVVVIVAIGMGLRRLEIAGRRTPTSVVVLVQVAWVAWIGLRMADASTFTQQFVPTRASVTALADLVHEAFAVMNQYAAPIPDDRTIVVLTAITVSLVAVLVDLVTASLRQGAWAGLPLLAVYAVPAAVLPAGLGVVAFLGPAVGYLLLLATEGSLRIRGWGAPIGLGVGRGKRAGRAAAAGPAADAEAATPADTGQLDSGLPSREPAPDPTPGRRGTGNHDDPDETVRVPLLGSTGRRVGFAALALAIAIPALVPDLTPRLPSSGGDGTGGEGRVIAVGDPVVDMNRDLRRGRNIPLFSFTTKTAAGKAINPDYLRTVVLDDFDGSSWKPSARTVPTQNSLQSSSSLPQAPGFVSLDDKPGDVYSFDVTSDYTSTWLPLAYPPSRVTVAGDWRYDSSTLDVVSAANGLTTAGISYTEEAVAVATVGSRLRDAGPAPADIVTRFTALPSLPPGQVTTLVDSITSGHDGSRYDQALAIQNYFRTQFKYSLDREPGTGTAALISFLNDKSGYCEQFAATMALMARIKGIPARVAIGYLPGEKQSDGSYTVRSHDAHSWPELYFAGTGWVRFEPTPATRTGDTPSWLNPANQDAGDTTPTATSSASAPVDTSAATAAPSLGPDPALDPTLATGTDSTTAWWKLPLALGIAALVILLCLVPAFVRRVRRRRRLHGDGPAGLVAELAWIELLDSCRDLGVRLPAGASPRATARVLVDGPGRMGPGHSVSVLRGPSPTRASGVLDDDAVGALNKLVHLVEQARYSGRPLSSAATAGVGDLVALVVESVRAPMSRGRRARALLLPASLADSAGAWSARVTHQSNDENREDTLPTSTLGGRRR